MLACCVGDLVLDLDHFVLACHVIAKEPLAILYRALVPTLSHEDLLGVVLGTYGRVRNLHRAGLVKGWNLGFFTLITAV